MRKWTSVVALVLIVGLGIAITGCIDGDTPPVENVQIEVINDKDGNPGGAVKVTWDPPATAEPDEYVVSVDGEDQVPVTTTEDKVYEPAAEIAVYAVYGDVFSTAETVDLTAEVTENIKVWSINDPSADHPSGFGFASDGSATAYAISNTDTWPNIDFYISMGQDGFTPSFTAPYARQPEPLNDEENATSDETGTFDNLMMVSATGQQLYITIKEISNEGLYGFWLDDNGEWDENDHFGKIYVVSLIDEGGGIYSATLNLAYQTIGGLRWVATD